MAYLIQHFTLELLRKGVIDRNEKPELYREALLEREKLADVMHAIGRELVPDVDRGLIGIRNFTEEEDDALVEGAGADTPPLPSFHRRRPFAPSPGPPARAPRPRGTSCES